MNSETQSIDSNNKFLSSDAEAQAALHLGSDGFTGYLTSESRLAAPESPKLDEEDDDGEISDVEEEDDGPGPTDDLEDEDEDDEDEEDGDEEDEDEEDGDEEDDDEEDDDEEDENDDDEKEDKLRTMRGR